MIGKIANPTSEEDVISKYIDLIFIHWYCAIVRASETSDSKGSLGTHRINGFTSAPIGTNRDLLVHIRPMGTNGHQKVQKRTIGSPMP